MPAVMVGICTTSIPLYNRAAYEVCQQVHPGDSLVWGRSAYAGCQRYPVYWGGDSDSDYNGMYHSLRGGLSLGLSGFPFWSHDVGGYFCTPEPNVYIRWMQFGMLSPLVRFHGTSAREPWAFGEKAVELYRQYAALRYSLIEYLYSEARRCAEDGTPMLRALVLDFPEDPMVKTSTIRTCWGETSWWRRCFPMSRSGQCISRRERIGCTCIPADGIGAVSASASRLPSTSCLFSTGAERPPRASRRGNVCPRPHPGS